MSIQTRRNARGTSTYQGMPLRIGEAMMGDETDRRKRVRHDEAGEPKVVRENGEDPQIEAVAEAIEQEPR